MNRIGDGFSIRSYTHSSLAQLFGEDSDGFRSGLDDDGSDMEICGGVKGGGVLSWGFSGWKGLIFVI
jgi:hypothetical protein